MTSGMRPIILLVLLGSSWGLYFSMLKIAVLSGISYTGILTLATVGVAIGMSAIALLRTSNVVRDVRFAFLYIYRSLQWVRFKPDVKTFGRGKANGKHRLQNPDTRSFKNHPSHPRIAAILRQMCP